MDYKASGVDIDAGNEVVRRIRSIARGTFTPGVLSDIGSFGGLFHMGASGAADPVLVASADGVGTKLRLAFMTGSHRTIGIDLVNHCVNDILVQGAEPLFFLDYLATGRLDPDVAVQIVEGLAAACRENGCALLGGETAEMPGFYKDGEYDVAGFIVGVVAREQLIDGARIAPGDCPDRAAVVGAPHQRLLAGAADRLRDGRARAGLAVPRAGTVDRRGAAGAAPVVSATSSVRCCRRARSRAWRTSLAAASPTTCRGCCRPGPMPTSIVRPGRCRRLFEWLQQAGGVPDDDMLRTFNMGIGLILAVGAEDAGWVLKDLRAAGESGAAVIGRIVRGRQRRQLLLMDGPAASAAPSPQRTIGVLISGRGSNLQALIDAVAAGTLRRADRAWSSRTAPRPPAWRVPPPRGSRPPWSITAGSRRATPSTPPWRRNCWRAASAWSASPASCGWSVLRSSTPSRRRILNIHPSLLPAFPGVDAQRQALEHGVRISGATVHLVTGELDGGPIVAAGRRAGRGRRHRGHPVGADSRRRASPLSGSGAD